MPFTLPNVAAAGFPDQAEPDSVDIDILTAGHSITGVVSGCAVTPQGSPDMTVAVASGTVSVLGVNAAVTSGNVTITAAHGSLPRKDLVVASSAGAKSVVTGTAAAQPLKPAVPASSVALAEIYVPAADTAISANQITDKRVIVLQATQSVMRLLARKSADQTSTTTTFANDTHISHAVNASEAWFYELHLIADIPNAADMKAIWTAPTLASSDWRQVSYHASAGQTWMAGIGISDIAGAGLLGMTTQIQVGGQGGSRQGVVIKAIFEVGGAGGTMQLQWAENTASGTLTVFKNSFLMGMKLN